MLNPEDTLGFHPGRRTFVFWSIELKNNGTVLFKATKFVVFCYSSCRHSLPPSPLERLSDVQPGQDLVVYNNIGKGQSNPNQLNSFSFLNNSWLVSGIRLSSDAYWETSELNFHPFGLTYSRIPIEYPAMISLSCVCLVFTHRWTPYSQVSIAEATVHWLTVDMNRRSFLAQSGLIRI